MGAKLGELNALATELAQESWHRPVQLRHLQSIGAIPTASRADPAERGEGALVQRSGFRENVCKAVEGSSDDGDSVWRQ